MTLRQLHYVAERHEMAERVRDRRAGEIVAMIYNAHRDATKDPKGGSWDDFFPDPRRVRGIMSDDEMFAAMMLWARLTAARGAT